MSKETGIAVPDFDAKLTLLFRQGAYAQGRDGGRLLICDRQSLAEALRVDLSRIVRWAAAQRIPRLKAGHRLAALFDIDIAWLEQPFDVFARLVTGVHAQSPWLSLIASAPSDQVGEITQLAPPPLKPLAARPESVALRVPAVERGSRVRVRFSLPLSPAGSPLWAGWQILLFSEDPRGFVCLLPRYLDERELPRARYARFPPAAWLEFDGLRIEEETGHSALVLVGVREPLPPGIEAPLKEDLEGPSLLPALDRLARHLVPLCPGPAMPPEGGGPSAAAGVRRLRFRVV